MIKWLQSHPLLNYYAIDFAALAGASVADATMARPKASLRSGNSIAFNVLATIAAIEGNLSLKPHAPTELSVKENSGA